MCQCHGHATSCVYDATIDEAKLSLDIEGYNNGGGVCTNCTVSFNPCSRQRDESIKYRLSIKLINDEGFNYEFETWKAIILEDSRNSGKV